MGVTQRNRKVVAIRDLREFFRESVDCALNNQRIAVDDHTAHYVVNLLTLYSRSEELYEKTPAGYGLKPLAFMLADALESETGEERNVTLQRLGDVSLFVSGILAGSFARKIIDIDYYISMGGTAYDSLSDGVRGSVRGRAIADVFRELAAKFQNIVEVLNEISEMAHVHSDKDIMRLYEVWIKTGSKRAERILDKLGIQPTLDAKTRFQH